MHLLGACFGRIPDLDNERRGQPEELNVRDRDAGPATNSVLSDGRKQLCQLNELFQKSTFLRGSCHEQLVTATRLIQQILEVTAVCVAGLSSATNSYTYLAVSEQSEQVVKCVQIGIPKRFAACSSSSIALLLQTQALLVKHAPEDGLVETRDGFPDDWQEILTVAGCRSFCAIPIMKANAMVGALLAIEQKPRAFARSSLLTELEVIGSWLSHLFMNEELNAYCDSIEDIQEATSIRDLMKSITSAILNMPIGKLHHQMQCRAAFVLQDTKTAVLFDQAWGQETRLNSMLTMMSTQVGWRNLNNPSALFSPDLYMEPREATAHASRSHIFACASHASLSMPYQVNTGVPVSFEQVEGYSFPLEGSALQDSIDQAMPVCIHDCTDYIQGRPDPCHDLLLATTLPNAVAMVVDVVFSAAGTPLLGLYLSLANSCTRHALQMVQNSVHEALKVLQPVLEPKIVQVLENWKPEQAELLSITKHGVNMLDTFENTKKDPSCVLASSNCARKLVPLMCGLQDKLSTIARINVHFLGKMDTAEELASLKLVQVLDAGGFGTVYLGNYKGVQLAVKVMYWNENDQEVLQNAVELAVLTTLSHPNIVQVCVFFADVTVVPTSSGPHRDGDRPAVMLVPTESAAASEVEGRRAIAICMEHCDMGSLWDGIKHGAFQRRSPVHGGVEPDCHAIYLTLMEVACALRYLHTLHVVHCDLKPSNVLLKSSLTDQRGFVTKLSDFGLVRIVQERRARAATTQAQGGGYIGTVTHCPPELMTKDGAVYDVTPSADVYAFGILMYEIYTGTHAYQGMSTEAILESVRGNNLRPIFDADAPLEYVRLASSCWAADPLMRPTADEVVAQLNSLLARFTEC